MHTGHHVAVDRLVPAAGVDEQAVRGDLVGFSARTSTVWLAPERPFMFTSRATRYPWWARYSATDWARLAALPGSRPVRSVHRHAVPNSATVPPSVERSSSQREPGATGSHTARAMPRTNGISVVSQQEVSGPPGPRIRPPGAWPAGPRATAPASPPARGSTGRSPGGPPHARRIVPTARTTPAATSGTAGAHPRPPPPGGVAARAPGRPRGTARPGTRRRRTPPRRSPRPGRRRSPAELRHHPLPAVRGQQTGHQLGALDPRRNQFHAEPQRTSPRLETRLLVRAEGVQDAEPAHTAPASPAPAPA